MKTIIITALAAGIGWAALPTSAEAARCPQGYIYRPSSGVCQAKGKSLRYTRQQSRSEARKARAAARAEARRARADSAKARKPAVAQEPRSMPVSPLMTTVAPDPFVALTNPYGRLVVPLPAAFEQHVMAWARENRHRLALESME